MASTVTFDVSSHSGLSARASALASSDADAFIEHNASAEDLLGLAELTLSDRSLDRARRAIARQVSFQIESGLSAMVYKRDKYQGVEKEYNGSLVDPMARSLADQVLATLGMEADGYAIIRSLR
jgi:hypothetical protein